MKGRRNYILRNRWILILPGVVLLGVFSFFLHRSMSKPVFEIVNVLGGNIFPSTILSTAATGVSFILPPDSLALGNTVSNIAIRVKSARAGERVRIDLAQTPYFSQSVSEFILPKARTEYFIYPDIAWDYEALKNNSQSQPVNIVVQVQIGDDEMTQRMRTFSMRSVNECPLGYYDGRLKFHDTSVFFAAYVNEEHPMIDLLLREALNTRIVDRFLGYQGGSKKNQVENQVYALWNVLQKRNFKYSSISNSSLSSNVVIAQRVRTLDNALESAQINCVDGSVLFASLLKAININPILVRIPGHMFVGYYTDKSHTGISFLETTMIGDVNLDDYFPEENLDSVTVGKTQNEMSRLTFEKSKEYATRKYLENDSLIHSGKVNYMFLEISQEIRSKIQPIGK